MLRVESPPRDEEVVLSEVRPEALSEELPRELEPRSSPKRPAEGPAVERTPLDPEERLDPLDALLPRERPRAEELPVDELFDEEAGLGNEVRRGAA